MCRLIGIAGGSGSGKTTVAKLLSQRLNCHVISSDSYYRPLEHLSPEERTAVNFDHPDAIEFNLLIQQLKLAATGNSIDIPEYCFESHTRLSGSVTISGDTEFLIVEGILIFAEDSLYELFSDRVFVEASVETRFRRRAERDQQYRGRTLVSIERQWNATVQPMFEQFVAPSKHRAEVIVSTEESTAAETVNQVCDAKGFK